MTRYHLLSITDVCDVTGLKKWTVYFRVRNGLFPKPTPQNASRSKWKLEDIREWLAKCNEHSRIDLKKFEVRYPNNGMYPAYNSPKIDQFIEEFDGDPNPLNKILENKTLYEHKSYNPVIYFLLRDDKVVYVGQTLCLMARMGMHCMDKEFDAYYWFPCHEKFLKLLESYYIFRYNPEYNGRHNGGKMHTAFSYDKILKQDMREVFKEMEHERKSFGGPV